MSHVLTKFIQGVNPLIYKTIPSLISSSKSVPFTIWSGFYPDKKDRNVLKYGHAIIHDFLAYHDEGVYLYDWNQWVTLATNMDLYGNIPISFSSITQFPIMYFSQTMIIIGIFGYPKGISVYIIINIIIIIQNYQVGIIRWILSLFLKY